MDQTRKHYSMMLGLMVIFAFLYSNVANGNVVFEVQHKFGGRRNSTLTALRSHDTNRHRRVLAALDFSLGGDAKVTDAALYYTKLAIGTPSQEYYVQVDTGSDFLWVNCGGCDKCPKKSSLGIDLKLYDFKDSSTGKQVTCDESFCNVVYNGQISGCQKGSPCMYSVTYADGSGAQGYFVTDTISFDRVVENLETASLNGTFSFGCSANQSGTKGTSTDRVEGIIGFGQSNSSIISQLALSGKTKKVFSHCLDGGNGGGIFAIGQVAEPKVQSTPLLSDLTHYNVMMKKIEVDGEIMDVPTDNFFDFGRKTVIDSGATLAYLPDTVYDLVIEKVMGKQPKLQL